MSDPPPRKKSFFSATATLFLLAPVLAAVAVYQLDKFDPSPYPLHELSGPILTAPLLNDRLLHGAEFVGTGRLDAPEDIAYDSESGVIYTGCADGWVKRVELNDSAAADSVVVEVVNTGGRPLGLTFGRYGEIIVADAYKGLLNISKDGSTVKLLTDEAEGLKFKLTDAADVSYDGVIYFTDASYKYTLKDHIFDFLEGKPHGRLLSYDPDTKHTTVLLNDLYFANGVVVSPDQNSVIFCETSMRRCRKYYIKGEKKGHLEKFLDNLPGYPDNIRYDGHGHYWIAFATGVTTPWSMAMRYPFLRKLAAIMAKYDIRPRMEKNAGALQVDLEGKPVAHYYDPRLFYISTGVKIGKHLYCGAVYYPYIISLDLDRHPASPAA